MIEKINIILKYFMNNYKSISYIIIGFIMLLSLSVFMYKRLVTEHLLRNIPFMLTEVWFYILMVFCINYLYAIKLSIKPSLKNIRILKLFSRLAYLLIPLLFLDKVLKTNKYTYKLTMKAIKYIVPPHGGKGQRIFLITANLLPRVILVIIFISDVFWFSKLNNFYTYIFLGLLPLVYTYHKFTMYQIKELAIEHLESFYDYVDISELGWDDINTTEEEDDDGVLQEVVLESEWKPHPRNKYHFHVVSMREYFQIELEKRIDECENNYAEHDLYEFDPSPLAKDDFRNHYRKINNKFDSLKKEDYVLLHKEFNSIAPHINHLNFRLHYLPQNEKRKYITMLNLVIYGLYVFGWGYILIKSINTLDDLPITMSMMNSIKNYLIEINPFTNP